MSDAPGQRFDTVYVRRRGRMTVGQARVLAAGDPLRCLDQPGWCALAAAPPGQVGLEIGFGMGQALAQWAAEAPQMLLVGMEVYQPGIGSLLLMAQEQALDNLRIIDGDAIGLLEASATRASGGWLDEVRVFFPDPWPKKRHHKRRLIQPPFVALLTAQLKPGGLLRVATDWAPYAEHINETLAAARGLRNCGGADGFAPRFAQRGTTRFEARGERLGHDTWDFCYERESSDRNSATTLSSSS